MFGRTSCALIVIILLYVRCNKNTDQLPPIKSTPEQLILPARLNGLDQFDFIFTENSAGGEDTVWLSIKNQTNFVVTDLNYVVELCRAVPQTYDNCDLHLTEQRHDTIPPKKTLENIFYWPNRKVALNDSLINVGVISYHEFPSHPLANIYTNVYSVFENNQLVKNHFGQVRGYILADGNARFLVKGTKDEYLTATGVFTGNFAFEGVLSQDAEILSPFQLDSITVNGVNVLIDSGNNKMNIRLKLRLPIEDTTSSMFLNMERTY